jgi:uracil-DNA glycosylase family 4
MTAQALPVVREYDPVAAGARCDLCPLKGNTVVPPKASATTTKLVFVGEAPGRKEEIFQQPFVGQTGAFLRGLCREVDIDFPAAALQNAALCRSNLDKENEQAAVCCAPRLLKELAALDPNIPIVTLGKTSTLSVLGVRSIMHSRGFVWTARELDSGPAWKAAKKAKLRASPKREQLWLKAQITEGRSKLAGRTVLPTVHPAFVLRSDTWLPILKLDLDRIGRWIRGELNYKKLVDNGSYVVVSRRDDVRRELRKLKDVISEDVETGASTSGGNDGADPLRNRLLCVGVSDGKHTVVIWPWRKTHAPLLNALHRRVRTISMHNGYNFDQIVLARNGVPFEDIEEKLEDTLIGHHTFASHMPQRLSHVSSVFIDASPWKITFKQGTGGASEKGLPPEKLSGEDLCKYNAADARIQAQDWLAMQADLADELDVYAVDKENARLCRSMIIKGIGVDLERRAWLHDEILKKQADLLEKMRKLLRRAHFYPTQLADVRKALFTTLGANIHIADPTDSGLPSTSQTTLERLKGSPTRAGRFADLLLQWRGAAKIDSTYVKVKTQSIDKPSRKTPGFARTHLNWRSYGAASGRYSCRLQSCPRAEYLKDKSVVLETRTREMYVAPPGYKLVYFDLSQAELRFAAYLSGDHSFIRACESGDVHTATAQLLFPAEAELIGRDPKGAGKPFRDVEKNSIFGFCYYAEPGTIFGFVRSKGLPVEMRDVIRMHDMVRQEFADYFRYVERNKRQVDKDGFMRCALSGRISWLGWHAGISDVANRPIQGGIASLMNVRLPKIQQALPSSASVVAQIHDAAILEVPERHVEHVRALVKEAWAEPVIIPTNGWGSSTRVEDGARSFVMPIDLKIGDRWSDFG